MIEAAPYTRQRLTPDRWKVIRELLLAQPYIHDVQSWNGEATDYNLNEFRNQISVEMRSRRFDPRKSLAVRMCEAHHIPSSEVEFPWLNVGEPKTVAPVIFSRASRYRNTFFPWKQLFERYGNNAVFVGLEEEHRMFCQEVGRMPHFATADLLEAAKVIAGATLFIGNQSCPYAIAEGLKQNAILEVWREWPNCIYPRQNCWPIESGHETTPSLDMLTECCLS